MYIHIHIYIYIYICNNRATTTSMRTLCTFIHNTRVRTAAGSNTFEFAQSSRRIYYHTQTSTRKHLYEHTTCIKKKKEWYAQHLEFAQILLISVLYNISHVPLPYNRPRRCCRLATPAPPSPSVTSPPHPTSPSSAPSRISSPTPSAVVVIPPTPA
jgi:hypothetical protein